MKLTKIVALTLLTITVGAGCAKIKSNQHLSFVTRPDLSREFNESQENLPVIPNLNDGDWYDIYVAPTFTGKPRILLPSIHTATDGSIRYVFNNRSAAGYDNVSAEGILCITGTKLLDSEGSKLKIFAYADTVNQRWIEPRKSEWQILGGSRNSSDKVRRVLYEAFCQDGKTQNDEQLRQRVRHYGSSHPHY